MARKLGAYDHLNREDKLIVELDIEKIARDIENMNYGTHRFLSVLVRIRRANRKTEEFVSCKMLTDGIEDLLNRGGF